MRHEAPSEPDDHFQGGQRLRVALVVESSDEGSWATPHVDELLSRRHEVVAVLPPGDGRLRQVLSQSGVRVVDGALELRLRPTPRAVRDLVTLRRRLRSIAPDVVYHRFCASSAAVQMAVQGLGIPLVPVTIGCEFLPSPLWRAASRMLGALPAGSALDELATRFQRSLRGRVERIPAASCGVDTNRFRPLHFAVRDGMRAQLGFSPQDFVLIVITSARPTDAVLDAWRRFRRGCADSRLLLVGPADGPRSRFRIGRGDPRVRLVPATEDLRAYYSAADLNLSSVLLENAGTALEAGAMGVPSVVSDRHGLSGEGACWVVREDDPNELVYALYEAHEEHVAGELWKRGTAARTWVVNHFDSRRSAADAVDVIEVVAQRKPLHDAVEREGLRPS